MLTDGDNEDDDGDFIVVPSQMEQRRRGRRSAPQRSGSGRAKSSKASMNIFSQNNPAADEHDLHDGHDVITRKPKQSVSKKVLALKRRSRGSATSSNSNTPSQLPVTDSYCDPSCKSTAEWMIADVWQQDSDCRQECDQHLNTLLTMCGSLKEHVPDSKHQMVDSITRNAMALCDRYKVELELLRQTTNEELFDYRKRSIDFIDAWKVEDSKLKPMSSCTNDAMNSVMNIANSLRGIYPHTSLAHAHPQPVLSK